MEILIDIETYKDLHKKYVGVVRENCALRDVNVKLRERLSRQTPPPRSSTHLDPLNNLFDTFFKF